MISHSVIVPTSIRWHKPTYDPSPCTKNAISAASARDTGQNFR